MQQDTIIFQLAMHFLPKIALRLERLFAAIQQACEVKNPIIHHYALKNIIEIIKLIEKPELKSRFVKELMRIEHLINNKKVAISEVKYKQLCHQAHILNHIAGRFGESIHQDPFLQSIRLAQSAHDSDCELQAPQLLFWLENKPVVRQANLKNWLEQLQTLWDTVTIYLALLRETAVFERIHMLHGFYQQSLPAKSTYHLLLIRMASSYEIIPKIHLGHHGLSLRLCDAYSMQEIKNIPKITIDLAICQI